MITGTLNMKMNYPRVRFIVHVHYADISHMIGQRYKMLDWEEQ